MDANEGSNSAGSVELKGRIDVVFIVFRLECFALAYTLINQEGLAQVVAYADL